MSHTKGRRKIASEMREAQLKKEQREAPRRARLKMETALAVAAFNVRALTQSPLTFYPTIGTAIAARRFSSLRSAWQDRPAQDRPPPWRID